VPRRLFPADPFMTAVVVTDHLTKRFGRHVAVDEVSFEVERGEVLGLLGPNGSGKTTILRILTGYLYASSGRAIVAGYDVVAQGLEARRHIGYVPEDVPLYGNMTVEEFLAFMGRLKGLRGAPLGEAVERGCAMLSLAPVRRLAVRKLSRGYRQRVAIAQALLNEPELLILDEPTNGLDPRQIIDLRELIRSLAARHTILVTSHILSEIERVASRVAILLRGRLLTVQRLGQGSRPRLRLRVRADAPGPVESALRAAPGVTEIVTMTPGPDGVHRVVLEVDDLDQADAVAAAVTDGGFGLLELSETRIDLERLFLDLTGRAAA
jgi:ABC-2 type transport system ATP-binding protein